MTLLTIAPRLARRLFAGSAAIALTLLAAGTGHTSDGRAFTHLSFSHAVSLPGVMLPAGQYTFEALRPDIVRVSSRDGRRVLYTGFTHSVRRPDGLRRGVSVTLGEARRGEPVPITRWYPERRTMGHQFIW